MEDEENEWLMGERVAFLSTITARRGRGETCLRRASEIMQIKSEYTEGKTDKSQKLRRNRDMSDVLLARSLMQDIAGKGRVNEVLYAAFKKLQRMFPHEDEPHKKWTENRLKSWWYRESENVMHWQMVELYKAAAKAKEERALLDAARREHAEFIEKTARLRSLLEFTDEAFFSGEIERLGEFSGRVDRAGNSGS